MNTILKRIYIKFQTCLVANIILGFLSGFPWCCIKYYTFNWYPNKLWETEEGILYHKNSIKIPDEIYPNRVLCLKCRPKYINESKE